MFGATKKAIVTIGTQTVNPKPQAKGNLEKSGPKRPDKGRDGHKDPKCI